MNSTHPPTHPPRLLFLLSLAFSSCPVSRYFV